MYRLTLEEVVGQQKMIIRLLFSAMVGRWEQDGSISEVVAWSMGIERIVVTTWRIVILMMRILFRNWSFNMIEFEF